MNATTSIDLAHRWPMVGVVLADGHRLLEEAPAAYARTVTDF